MGKIDCEAKSASDDDEVAPPLTSKSESVVYLPEPVVAIILTRTQAQSLLGFRVVSNWLKKSIDDPSVELPHYERSRESYLICSVEDLFYQFVHWKNNLNSDKICCLNIKKLFDKVAPYTHYQASCQGLLLYSNSSSLRPYILNPMRCEIVRLPTPPTLENMGLLGYGYGLGFCNGKYKCLFWSNWEGDEGDGKDNQFICHVLTIGEKKWKRVCAPSLRIAGQPLFYGKCICWSDAVDDSNDVRFVTFKLEEELFDVLRFRGSEGAVSSYLVELMGKICVVEVGMDLDLMITSLDKQCHYKIRKIRHMSEGLFEVRGMLGEELLLFCRENQTIITFNVHTELMVLHDKFPKWIFKSEGLKIHTPKAGIVSLSRLPGFSRIKSVIGAKDGCECSWWK